MRNHFIQTGKRTATDKQDLGGINLQEFLLRMFTPTLRRNGSNSTFDQFQQCLLYAFTGNVSGNGRVVRLTRNLVDFIDVDNTALCFLYVVIAFLQQLLNDVFNVFAHITGFGQRGCVGHGERDIQQTCQRFCQQRFTGTGRTDQQNVTFAQLDAIAGIAVAQTFVMVVYRDRQHFFRLFLTDNVIVQVVANFMRRR